MFDEREIFVPLGTTYVEMNLFEFILPDPIRVGYYGITLGKQTNLLVISMKETDRIVISKVRSD